MIIIDSHEKKAQVLAKSYFNFKIEKIKEDDGDCGDFTNEDKTFIVERKEVKDFLNSIMDKSMFNQIRKMQLMKNPILIVEGDLEQLCRENKHQKNYILSTLFEIMFRCGLMVILTKDLIQTLEFLMFIDKHSRGDIKEVREVFLRFKLPNPKEVVLASIPGVGPRLAKRLMEYFGSPRNVLNASKEMLMEVPGIGEGKADKILDATR
jgi:Fanconi anemia group M protein